MSMNGEKKLFISPCGVWPFQTGRKTGTYFSDTSSSAIRSRIHCYVHYVLCNVNTNLYFIYLKFNFSWRTLQWRHNGRDSVSTHQPHDCLLNRLFRRRSKKTSKLSVNGLCEGNSPVTGEFPAQMASNAENFPFDDVSWWSSSCM